MDLIYGQTSLKSDPNVVMTLPNSLVNSILTSWTGQLETLNNQLSMAVPYFPSVITDRGLKTIEPIFTLPVFDRFFPSGSYFSYRGPRVYSDHAVSQKFITTLPLSAKANYPFRMSASPISVTILVTSSSIIQGTIGFYAQRNYKRTTSLLAEKFTPIVDAANCLGVMNLATDRNITLTLSYDELYSLIDHEDVDGAVQSWNRAIVAYPITPILSTTDTPTTIYFSCMYGTGVPRAAYLINAPNLTRMQKVLPDTINTLEESRDIKDHKSRHVSPVARMLDDFFVMAARKGGFFYKTHLNDKAPK